MKELTEAGVLDLGGEGSYIIEIEYRNEKGEFKEAFYRITEDYDVEEALMVHTDTHTILSLAFPEETHNIVLPDRCEELIAVRSVEGNDITLKFVSS